jgi:hypothetical protein
MIRKRFYLAVTAVAMLSLSAWPTAATEADPAAIRQVKNIALIALLSDNLEVQYIGATAFHNYQYLGRVDGWQINAHVRQTLRETLGHHQRFVLKDVPYDEAAMWEAYRTEGTGFVASLRSLGGTQKVDALRTHLARLASAHSVEGFLLVLPGGKQLPLCQAICSSYGNTGIGYYGLATLSGPGPFGGPHAGIRGSYGYVSLEVYFVLAEEARVAASTSVAAHQTFATVSMKDFAKVSPGALSQLEQLIKRLISTELPGSILRLGILNTPLEATAANELPGLVVNADCCGPVSSRKADIVAAYGEAAKASKISLAGEPAVLTIKRFQYSSGTGRTDNRIEAILSVRGNQYWIQDSSRISEQLDDATRNIGETSFAKVRSVLPPAAGR